MTFRARPVSKRQSRAGWNSEERRTALINGGFVAAIVISAIILVGYAGWSWYTDHFGAAATVDGQTISRDDLRTRIGIETFRINYTEQRIRDLLAAGHITQDQADQQFSFLDQRRQSIDTIALERLVDATLQNTLLGQEGLSISDADIDTQLQTEATLDEQRHAWVIEVEPDTNPDTGQVGDAEKAAAKAKAEKALAELKSGKTWEDVAKTESTAASAPQAGDLGWIPKDSGYDASFMDAVFAVAQDAPTDVVAGSDDIYRIGRVTEITPKSVDGTFQTKIDEAKLKLSDYRNAVRADVVRKKLSDKVVADLSKPGPQRHVLQIFLPTSQPSPDGVKVRHILFSPNDAPDKAKDLKADDPAWQKAKDEAFAAYQQLLRDPSKFDILAREKSDDTGSKAKGGKLDGWQDPTTPLAKPFADAIFQKGLRPMQLLEPVKTDFGWHVIQFMRAYGDGDEAFMDDLKTRADAGIDFAQLARDYGEGDEAKKGGDIGWIIAGQLPDLKEGQIFETKVGEVSDVANVQDDGLYLFKVLAEETRPPSKEQIKIFEDSGFTDWYTLKKSAAKIERLVGTSAATG
jgi:parvulin-like peptidyl-prolyl isomerase